MIVGHSEFPAAFVDEVVMLRIRQSSITVWQPDVWCLAYCVVVNQHPDLRDTRRSGQAIHRRRHFGRRWLVRLPTRLGLGWWN